MNTPKLLSTKDYSLFQQNPVQRPIRPAHVRKIARIMKRSGFWPSKAIQCFRDNGKLVVIDGHHRLEAAKSIGTSVYYVVETHADPDRAMQDGNGTGAPWTPADDVRRYAIRGNKHYIELQNYAAAGIPLNMAASLLHGESAASGNLREALRDGRFTIRTRDHADKILKLIEFSTLCKRRNFIAAVSLCLWLKEFDFQTFSTRLSHNLRLLPNYSNRDDFLDAIEEIYNFRTRSPIPIAFMAKEASKKRQAALPKTA